MTLFKRKKGGEEGANDEVDDERPRDMREIFGGGRTALPSGKAFIDAWRDAWNHPGRLPTHVYDEASNRLYPLQLPDVKCPEADCGRYFPGDARGQAVLAEHVQRDHGGILRRIAKAVRRENR